MERGRERERRGGEREGGGNGREGVREGRVPLLFYADKFNVSSLEQLCENEVWFLFGFCFFFL